MQLLIVIKTFYYASLSLHSEPSNKYSMYIIIQGQNSPLRARLCKSTVELTSTCTQTEVKVHTASLGVAFGQHAETPIAVGFQDRN